MTDTGRLSPKQLEFQQQMLAMAHQKGLETPQERALHNFFPELFRIAAIQIENDVEEFCDRAEMLFEEIEAFGQEPQLDGDWLQEITGEKDSFYFSTDSLVSELPPLTGKRRGRKSKSPNERDVVEAVQQAISEAEEDDVLAVAHLENPSDWIQKIAISLRKKGGKSDFGMLRRDTGLSPGALFLGLLLGQEQWILRQVAFYGEVEVKSRDGGEAAG